VVELKAHRAAWSGSHPENSLAALRECYAQRVARVEIDFLFRGDDFVVTHDEPRRGTKLPSLREALDVVRSTPSGPTVLMLDAKGDAPWPKDEVSRLLRLVEPVRDRIFFGSPADWNLRRLRDIDPALTLAFDPQYYLTWSSRTEKLPGRVGAYGYHDTHPLALRRSGPTAAYLRERFEMLVALVPDAREVHLRLGFFERMLDDGFDAAKFLHDADKLVDVWTIDAGTRRWRERVARAVAAGVDIVTTNTPRQIATAFRSGA
jgi:glycerophosphoryl diester phosphodiesterase